MIIIAKEKGLPEVDKHSKDSDYGIRMTSKGVFYIRLIVYPLAILAANGSFLLLAWLTGLLHFFALAPDEGHELIRTGILFLAYAVYMVAFAKGLLFVTDRAGLDWIFSGE